MVEIKAGRESSEKTLFGSEPFTVLLHCEISGVTAVAKRLRKIGIKPENEPGVPGGGWRTG